ncbi:MAG: hypothetical protein HY287_00310 [Planctomycetes bacterium]|nr:hypothetical protein [Planctomycetota bacterium]MBI3832755.1 hypothetical protein [Planctomycetota bacterium]
MTLGWIDLCVVIFYFLATIAIGFWFGRGERNTKDFFLGGRKQHWLLAGISIIATEISAMTFIGVPGVSFRGDWWYLQMQAGAIVGQLVVVALLLPAFYGGAVTTVYEYLGQRFGPGTRVTASLMFFASRILGSGMRLLLASMAVSVIFNWPLQWVIVVSAGVATLYATFGGIKAILWTDAFQALIFVSAAVVTVVVLLERTPGGAVESLSSAWHAGRLHIFNWGWHPKDERSFWLLLISAAFLNTAALGVDQDLTQRMLTCPNLREGQKSLLFKMVLAVPIVCTFLMIGSLLWVYYQRQPSGSIPSSVTEITDRIFPFFIATGLPRNVGLQGLLVAAIFAASMGSLSSAIGALSSTAVNDVYRLFAHEQSTDRKQLLIARVFTAGFGVLLAAVAIGFSKHDQMLQESFKWASLVFGGMLGIFLLGVTTRSRGSDWVNPLVMIFSVAGLAALKMYQEWGQGNVHAGGFKPLAHVAWPWWVVIGTTWTYVVAACFRTKHIPETPLPSIENRCASVG